MKVFIEADSIACKKMSGIGHTTLEIIKELNKQLEHDKTFSVTIIVPFKKKRFVTAHELNNIRIRSLPMGQKYLNYLLTRTSIPVPVDLWFGRGIYIFPNYKTWFVPFSRSLTFVHDIAFMIHPDATNPKNLLYLKANFKRWLKRATKIISISQASAGEFVQHFPEFKDKVEIIYLGVDPAVYYPRSQAEIKAAIHKYSLPEDYFLSVGNLEPRKNVSRLLDAYKLYCDSAKTHAKARALIGADGWKNDEIKAKITALKS